LRQPWGGERFGQVPSGKEWTRKELSKKELSREGAMKRNGRAAEGAKDGAIEE
jgi:hypothetical protein